MKLKIFTILGIIVIIGVAFWIIPVLKNRYFLESIDSNTQEDAIPSANNAEKFIDNKDSLKDDAINTETYFEVKNEDCANRCENFKADAKKFDYCQEFCGFTLVKSQKSK